MTDAICLFYVLWLQKEQRRTLTPAEVRGPFEAFRWALYPRGRRGHPQQGGPWFGVVSVRKIMYRVHMVRSMDDEGLFRLNTDVWLKFL